MSGTCKLRLEAAPGRHHISSRNFSPLGLRRKAREALSISTDDKHTPRGDFISSQPGGCYYRTTHFRIVVDDIFPTPPFLALALFLPSRSSFQYRSRGFVIFRRLGAIYCFLATGTKTQKRCTTNTLRPWPVQYRGDPIYGSLVASKERPPYIYHRIFIYRFKPAYKSV